MCNSKLSHINVSAHPTQVFTLFSVFSPILDAVLAPRNITAGTLAIISGIKQLRFKSRLWWRKPGWIERTVLIAIWYKHVSEYEHFYNGPEFLLGFVYRNILRKYLV